MKFMSSSCVSGSLRSERWLQSDSHVSAKQAAYISTVQHMGIVHARQDAYSWQCWFILLQNPFFSHCRIIALRLALKFCASHGHVRDAHSRLVCNHEKQLCGVSCTHEKGLVAVLKIIYWIHLINDCQVAQARLSLKLILRLLSKSNWKIPVLKQLSTPGSPPHLLFHCFSVSCVSRDLSCLLWHTVSFPYSTVWLSTNHSDAIVFEKDFTTLVTQPSTAGGKSL